MVLALTVLGSLAWLAWHSDKPRLRIGDVKRIRISTAQENRPPSADEMRRFVEAYHEAHRLDDDLATTHAARVEVVFRSGRQLQVLGGSENFQTITSDGAQINVFGEKLRQFMESLATDGAGR